MQVFRPAEGSLYLSFSCGAPIAYVLFLASIIPCHGAELNTAKEEQALELYRTTKHSATAVGLDKNLAQTTEKGRL